MIRRFKSREGAASASAFVQQREKLLPSATETLFQQFTSWLCPTERFQGYRLLAADGLDLKSAAYPGNPASYRPGTARQLEQQGLVVSASSYCVPPQITFDDLEPGSTGFSTLSFRIVRIETENNDTELLITNLDPKCFPPAALKRLYAMRWGIDTP